MRKKLVTIAAACFSASLGLAAGAPTEAQSVQGTWTLNNWTIRDSVRMTLSYRNKSTRWEWGCSQELEDLHGLSKDQLHAVSTPAKFTLERDPGVFFFEGTLLLGVGRGEFRFVPNPSFAAKLVELGYEQIEESDASLMIMAAGDVSLAYAAEVKRLGLKEVTARDLVRFRDHGISLSFVRELVATGYPGLTADDVVRLRDHGIDGRYVARIQSAGLKGVTVDQIVKLHDHGVD